MCRTPGQEVFVHFGGGLAIVGMVPPHKASDSRHQRLGQPGVVHQDRPRDRLVLIVQEPSVQTEVLGGVVVVGHETGRDIPMAREDLGKGRGAPV